METDFGRAVFTVVVLTLIMLFAILPIWREKRKKQRDSEYTQNLAREYLARSREKAESSSQKSNVPATTTVLFASRDKKGEQPNDTLT